MNIALIPAAGSGSRIGSARAKQFLELSGIPILIRTLKKFEDCEQIDQIVVALPAAELSGFLELTGKYGLRKITRIIAGGNERQESVAKGLQAINNPKAEIVVVHDAVRPFVTVQQITDVIDRARETGAAMLALPVTDTVKEVSDGIVTRTLDRKHIYLAQTPQAFRIDLLREAHRKAASDGVLATDEAALVERLGSSVAIVEGSPQNIKITRKQDLALAELILKETED
ncbi:MAG TPA: 2-C-methyl-D-erythritol 4-phosphate cytidylyltransferase [Blastocatellia bacterium]|nr:2-C-methyl-D-erythritol 4-phosphate cytidylyltransferase [Blastocatellia bacterium]